MFHVTLVSLQSGSALHFLRVYQEKYIRANIPCTTSFKAEEMFWTSNLRSSPARYLCFSLLEGDTVGLEQRVGLMV